MSGLFAQNKANFKYPEIIDAIKMAKYSRKRMFGIVSIIFGVFVIAMPNILAYVIGLYLAVSGILNLLEE